MLSVANTETSNRVVRVFINRFGYAKACFDTNLEIRETPVCLQRVISEGQSIIADTILKLECGGRARVVPGSMLPALIRSRGTIKHPLILEKGTS